MPSISDRSVSLPDNYERVDSTPSPTPPMDTNNTGLEPGMNTTIRCTLPPIFAAADNLRQFYSGGATPQFRVLPAAPISK